VVDDSLAGQLRVCLSGAGCPADAWASALLLVSEKRLSGAVHVAEKGCRAPLGKKGGLTLTRPRPAAAAPARPPRYTPEQREKAQAILRDGAAWLHEGNFEKARERFREAVEVDATIPEAYNGVGVTYRMRNDLPEALAWYKKALAVDPDFGDAYYNMACVYALQGERTLALRYLQIAAMNGYVTAEGVDGDDDLASIRTTREYRALRDRM
jgi:tetratricopeptide (TPR) repeat protein